MKFFEVKTYSKHRGYALIGIQFMTISDLEFIGEIHCVDGYIGRYIVESDSFIYEFWK